jgi:hypothetical protein
VHRFSRVQNPLHLQQDRISAPHARGRCSSWSAPPSTIGRVWRPSLRRWRCGSRSSTTTSAVAARAGTRRRTQSSARSRTSTRSLPRRGIGCALRLLLRSHARFEGRRPRLAITKLALYEPPFLDSMVLARIADTVYIHGSRPSRAMRTVARGGPACVAGILLEGLALARSALSTARTTNLWWPLVVSRRSMARRTPRRARCLHQQVSSGPPQGPTTYPGLTAQGEWPPLVGGHINFARVGVR